MTLPPGARHRRPGADQLPSAPARGVHAPVAFSAVHRPSARGGVWGRRALLKESQFRRFLNWCLARAVPPLDDALGPQDAPASVAVSPGLAPGTAESTLVLPFNDAAATRWRKTHPDVLYR
jgi:hypothetical protein